MTRTCDERLDDLGVSVKDYGALADGSDDSQAIRDAIASGAKNIFFPAGNYHCHNITGAVDGQQFIGIGEVNLVRNGTSALLSFTAADILFRNIVFWADLDSTSYTGDVVILTGARNQLHECAARFLHSDGGSDKILIMQGSGAQIIGARDTYNGNVVIGTSGTVCLYPYVSHARIGSSLTLVDTGHGTVADCVLNNLTIDRGAGTTGAHGPSIRGCRVINALTITQSQTCVGSNTTVSGVTGSVIVGDGSNPTSGVTFDSSFSIGVATPGFGTFTVNAQVTDSSFNLINIPAGNSVAINSPLNAIWDLPRTYVPTLTASGGSPAVGSGGGAQLSGTIYRNGLERRAVIQFVFGTGSDLGTGETRISVPDACGPSNYGFGGGSILDSGTGIKPIVPRIASGTSYMVFITDTTSGFPAGNALDSTTPITFASGDNILAAVNYSVK